MLVGPNAEGRTPSQTSTADRPEPGEEPANDHAPRASLAGRLAGAWRGLDPYARKALWVALGSRLLVFLAGFVVAVTMRAHEVHPIMRFAARAEVFNGWLGHLLNPWAHFDGVWFIHIANEGYRVSNNTPAFFPLYPLLLRAGGYLTGSDYELTGILLSCAFFLVAMAVLYRLVATDLTPRIGFCSVLFVSLFPASFYFQAVYSESLFLLAAVCCFYWARQERWALAGVAGMLATATRLSGIFLLIPMAIAYLHARGRAGDRQDSPRERVLGWFLLVPAGVAAYAAYLAVFVGGSGGFGEAERAWGRDPTFPLVTLWRAAVKAYLGAAQLLTGHGVPADPAYVGQTLAFIQRETAIVNLVSFLALAGAVCAICVGWRRLPLSYSLFAACVVSLPLLAPRPQVPLMSMPRFVLVAFPVMVALAAYTDRRPRTRWVVAAAFAAGLVFLTGRFVLWLFVA